jgi:polyphosphate:AMP phosphotransferase
MLEKAMTATKDIDSKARAKELQEELGTLQIRMKDKGLPVIILFEGWGASGKGTLIADTIKLLDPRFFKVVSVQPVTEQERRYPLMKRYFEMIPEYGKMLIMDRSWYRELAAAKIEEDISDKEYGRRVKAVNTFERQLTDDGCLIIKIFLNISASEQKKRFEKLAESSSTKWRVTDKDHRQNKHYKDYAEKFEDMLGKTNTEYVPWNIIDSTDKQSARCCLFTVITEQIKAALEADTIYPPESDISKMFRLRPTPLLSEVSLEGKTVTEEEYEERLKDARKELAKLHGKLYKLGIPVVIAFEGWDAAGKGGAIKRIGSSLDPRGYECVPVASPNQAEKARHYLWRFWTRLPKTGHITIFDRSWYGRVMVERLEGFTPVERCAMAYREINEFEKELSDCGTVVMKFWMQIDKDEQLRRFNDRMNTPEKRWKITDEDWRNREKWDLYETAIDEMIQKTSTETAPWIIVEGNDKKYARLKVLQTVIDRIKDEIKNRK